MLIAKISDFEELVIEEGKIFHRQTVPHFDSDVVRVTKGDTDPKNKKVTFRWPSGITEYDYSYLSVLFIENVSNILV